MGNDCVADLSDAWSYLFKETFEGPPPEGGIYLDNHTGLFETLEPVNSFEASLIIEGASVAAHAEHLRFYLEVLSGYMNGIVRGVDWAAGWKKLEVSEEEWGRLKDDLAEIYREISGAITRESDWNRDSISMAMALIAHSAYHLSAIRQILKHI